MAARRAPSFILPGGKYDQRVRLVRDLPSAGLRILLELEVRLVQCSSCGTVKRERLDFLADNSHYPKRFAFYVGRVTMAADRYNDWPAAVIFLVPSEDASAWKLAVGWCR